MANKKIFNTLRAATPQADTRNSAGGIAFVQTPKLALAQGVCTFTIQDGFYNTAEDQLATFLRLADNVDALFEAKAAVYGREMAKMKDAPVVLLAHLFNRDKELAEKVFPRVVDNGKQLRTFAQVVRSGVLGRKSFSNAARRCMERWFADRKPATIFRNSMGKNPSLADVIRMVHPKPATAEHEALFGYLVNRRKGDYNREILPTVVKEFEAFKRGESDKLPTLPKALIENHLKKPVHWAQMLEFVSWTWLRMNLNVLARKGLLQEPKVCATVAERLQNPSDYDKQKLFPHHLLATYLFARENLPRAVSDALHAVMGGLIEEMEPFSGRTILGVDVSGSMTWTPVTGMRRNQSSEIKCVDVAALFGAIFLKKNPDTLVLPFDGQLHLDAAYGAEKLEPRDTVFTLQKRLSAYGGGCTYAHLVLDHIVEKREKADRVIVLSDMEVYGMWDASYAGVTHPRGETTPIMGRWLDYRRLCPDAKLYFVNLAGSTTTTQAKGNEVHYIGGFSDDLLRVLGGAVANEQEAQPQEGPELWLSRIEAVEI
jgi:60 kDa SS-A/Ro ribonucleoprotein